MALLPRNGERMVPLSIQNTLDLFMSAVWRNFFVFLHSLLSLSEHILLLLQPLLSQCSEKMDNVKKASHCQYIFGLYRCNIYIYHPCLPITLYFIEMLAEGFMKMHIMSIITRNGKNFINSTMEEINEQGQRTENACPCWRKQCQPCSFT